jgi:signal transduction histidine kinase
VVALYPPKSGVRFQLDLSDGLPAISADPVKLRQVLHNLVKNAQEATPEGEGVIQLLTRMVPDRYHCWVELLVRDNGPGVPPEQVERVFEPYVTTKTKGTGLGLAIVKKIIEEHGGTIRHDTGYRDGAGFIIRLPLPDAVATSETVING